MKPFAIIFDMDGVIVDSNPFHKIALHQFCEKYGFHLNEEALRNKVYGRTNKEWIPAVFGRKLEAEEWLRLEEEKESLFRKLYQSDIKPLPGLREFLDRLDQHHIARAIGTSAPRSNVDFVLSGTGLEKYFNVILDESFVHHGKPDPEIYLKVAEHLSFPPERCIVFEDSLSGIEAARRAGAKVVGVTTTHRPEELSATDLAIADFNGLDPVDLGRRLFRD